MAFVERDLRQDTWTVGLQAFDAVVRNQAVHELRHTRHAPPLNRGVVRTLVPGGAFLMSDHYVGEGAMQNRALYMTPGEHEAALRAGGFPRIEALLQKRGMILYEAIGPGG